MTDLRLATFNMLHGRSAQDGSVSRAGLEAAVRELDVDVLGLQEVDADQPRSGLLDQASVVATALGAAEVRYLPTLVGTPGRVRDWTACADGEQGTGMARYGIALVSRLPVQRWAHLRLRGAPFGVPLVVPTERGPRVVPVPDEPRSALAAVVQTAAGPVSVITAHLSFVPGYNVRQLRQVVRWARAELPAPRVLLGDLNLPGALPGLFSRWTQVSREPTYPSGRPRVAFDAALGDGLGGSGWRVEHVRTQQLPVSDHRALLVELRR